MADSLQRPARMHGKPGFLATNMANTHSASPETAPLLETANDERIDSSLTGRANSIAQERLTPLTKVLLILALVLLLLSSVGTITTSSSPPHILP